MTTKLAQSVATLVALAGMAAAQVTGAGSNPMEAVRNKINNANAPRNQAAAEALDATTSKKPSAASPMNPMSPKPAAKPAAAPAAKAKTAPEMGRKAGGKRDPFVNPVVRASSGKENTTACDTGKRCLAIREMSLRGVVKSANGMIAVVENPAHKTYFLREKDPVLDGIVVKITGEAVVFRENVTDNLGHESTKEVVKTVNPPAAS